MTTSSKKIFDFSRTIPDFLSILHQKFQCFYGSAPSSSRLDGPLLIRRDPAGDPSCYAFFMFFALRQVFSLTKPFL